MKSGSMEGNNANKTNPQAGRETHEKWPVCCCCYCNQRKSCCMHWSSRHTASCPKAWCSSASAGWGSLAGSTSPSFVFTITGVRISPFMLCWLSPVHTFNAQWLQTDNISQQTLHFGLEHAILSPLLLLLGMPSEGNSPQAINSSSGETAQSEGRTPKLNIVCFFPLHCGPWGPVLWGVVHAPQPVLLRTAILPSCCRKIISIVPHARKLPGQTRSYQGLQACSRF